jgi:hypothetical protein
MIWLIGRYIDERGYVVLDIVSNLPGNKIFIGISIQLKNLVRSGPALAGHLCQPLYYRPNFGLEEVKGPPLVYFNSSIY